MTTEDLKNLQTTLHKMIQQEAQYREVVIRDFRCDAREMSLLVSEVLVRRAYEDQVETAMDAVHVSHLDIEVTLRPTTIVGNTKDGVTARYWLGLTKRGNPIGAFITMVADLSLDTAVETSGLAKVPDPILPGAGEKIWRDAHIPVFFPDGR